MCPMVVVVRGVGGEDCRQVPFADDEHPISALPAGGAHPAFAKALARGACGGVLITSIPAAVKTVSKAAVNLVSRSRSRNRNESARWSRSISRLRACWATHAPLGGRSRRRGGPGGWRSPGRTGKWFVLGIPL